MRDARRATAIARAGATEVALVPKIPAKDTQHRGAASPARDETPSRADPLQVCEYRCASAPTRELMILLPGIGDLAEDYESHGFVDAVRRSGAPADLVAVDVHVGYYARRTVLERLRKDVIAPAREAGYEKIWLGGISLGGLGASLYAAEYAADLQGLVLLAPFLGDPRIVREIAGAGGLGALATG